MHGDRQCMEEHGGSACLLKEMPDGFAQYVYLPQCIFGEVNDIRPPGSPTIEFWLEHAYKYTKDPDTFLRIRPTGFFVSGAGSHIHVEEGSNPAKAMMTALSPKEHYEPHVFPVDDYDAPSDVDSVIWCTMEFPMNLEFLSVWVHTHHQFTHDMWWFRGHPRDLGLDSGPLVLENHYTPIRLPDAGIDRHQFKNYVYNNMRKNHNRLVCKLNEDRFEKGEEGVLPKGLKNDIYDRMVMPNCSGDLKFERGELITYVALHGPTTGKVTKSKKSVMHSAWNAEYVVPGCNDWESCHHKFLDDLHLPCLESSYPRAIALALAQMGWEFTRENAERMRKKLAAFANQGGGTW